MKRRVLIALFGIAALGYPLVARAQQKNLPIIGFLSGTSADLYAPFIAAFRDGLKEAGFVEGQTVTIEYRWAEGNFDRLPVLANDLVHRKVDVIVTSGGTLAALAAKEATSTIPTAFLAGDDAVKVGLVSTLARPGGNRTGISFLVVDLNVKRLELLLEIVPKAKKIALLVNPSNSNAAPRMVQEVKQAGDEKGVNIEVFQADTVAKIDSVFPTLAQQQPDALLIGNDSFFNSQRDRFVVLAARHGIPASYESSEAVRAGGLISYGPDYAEIYRLLGTYAGKLLKGAKPADLPVQQPTKFELVINLKTANALGLTVPQSLLARADEVIE